MTALRTELAQRDTKIMQEMRALKELSEPKTVHGGRAGRDIELFMCMLCGAIDTGKGARGLRSSARAAVASCASRATSATTLRASQSHRSHRSAGM
jgi:hypothetical protein